MVFARRVFLIAGIYGLIALLPIYLLESRIGRDQPPAITHPEFFYGFVGVGVSWQVAFLIISPDPARFRPLMIPAGLEKASFGFAPIPPFVGGRPPGPMPPPHDPRRAGEGVLRLRRHRPVRRRSPLGPDARCRPDRPGDRRPVRHGLHAEASEPRGR